MALALRMTASTLAVALFALAVPAAAAAKFGYVRQWGTDGSGVGQFTGAQAIAVSPAPDNRVFVADTGNHRVQRFNRNGGSAMVVVPYAQSGPGHLSFPSGIAADQSQFYVADFNGLHAYTLDGALRWEKTVVGSGPGELNAPESVSVDPAADGLVYVADNRNHRIAEFTKAGVWVRNLGRNDGDGSAGTGFGEFTYPVGVLYAPAQRAVWVTEEQSSRLTSMGPTGAGASIYPTDLRNPKEMAQADDKHIWIADFFFDDLRVLLFGPNRGELRGTEATPGKFGVQGIATDSAGNLYLMDIEGDSGDRVLVYGNVPDSDTRPAAVTGIKNGSVYKQDIFKHQRKLFVPPVETDEDAYFKGGASIYQEGTGDAISFPVFAAKNVRLTLKRRLVRAGEKTKLKLPIPRRARRKIRRALRHKRLTAKVAISATDRAGNARRFEFKIRLKRFPQT